MSTIMLNATKPVVLHTRHQTLPVIIGASKIPSTAFCLLLRLLTMRCTEKQMASMLDHPDSPYIRCIGFLFLRYASDPANLYDWFQPYLYDQEKVRVAANPSHPEITIGDYCRNLLTDMNYFSTLLPRLPILIERDVKVKLMQGRQIEERGKKNMENLEAFTRVGQRVRALYGDDENPITWYEAYVDRVIRKDEETGEDLHRPRFTVTFPEYGNTEIVEIGEMELCEGEMGEISMDRGRCNDYEYDRERSHRGGMNENRQRNWNGGHCDSDRKRERPNHGPGNSSQFDERWERGYHGGRNMCPSQTRSITDEQVLMEAVRREEREKSAARGRQYAQRPASFKRSIASKQDREGKTRMEEVRPHRFEREGKGRYTGSRVVDVPAPAKTKTPEELAVFENKRRKLMQRYG